MGAAADNGRQRAADRQRDQGRRTGRGGFGADEDAPFVGDTDGAAG